MQTELGQLGFEEYVETVPVRLSWKDCTETTKKAWEAAAQAIKRQVLEELGLEEI